MALKIKDKLNKVKNVVLSIASFFMLLFLLRWSGIKGILSFFTGMALMAYLLLSNNIMVRSLVKIFGSEENIKEIMK